MTAKTLTFAIPLADGKLCLHFGHCQQFALVTADPDAKRIGSREDVTPPPHEPGLLPRWLAQKGATVILAGGMGQRAQALFAGQGIAVVVGVPCDTPEALVAAYLQGTLQAGDNVCDH